MIHISIYKQWTSQRPLVLKNMPANAGNTGFIPGLGIAWKILWTEEPGRLQTMRPQKVDMTE